MDLLRCLLPFLICAVVGCAESGSYPQTAAAPAIGRAANCDKCGQHIESVGEEHLFAFQGVQYTVCGEACAKQLAQAISQGTFETERQRH